MGRNPPQGFFWEGDPEGCRCPHATLPRARTCTAPEFEIPKTTPVPPVPVVPGSAGVVSGEHRQEYQENILLILLFLGWLFFGLKDLLTPGGITILCPACVYFDAQNIHAGRKFKEVSLLGEVATWQPITWAAVVFIGSFIGMAIYLLSRQEIYTANT